jgi:diguanylate cyclase (GGDEF)-like protein
VIELILVVVLAVAFVAAVVALVVARRGREAAEARARAAVDRLTRTLGSGPELAASLDVAEVVRRTVEAAAALPGVDAVVLDAESPDGEHTRATVGVSDEEAERARLQAPPSTNVRALEVVYRYRLDEVDKATSFLRAGVVVPLKAQTGPIGTLTAFTRSPSHRFPDETVAALEKLAARAGPALDNAHRFTEARLLADVDSLTGLQNQRCFHELLAREISRARRYERQLALIVFDLDDFKSVNDRLGHLKGDVVLAQVAERVRRVVRSSDIACRVGGDEFAVIMPETGLPDAENLANRIARTVAERPLGSGETLYVSAGVAELRADDEGDALFERSDEALYRAKQSGKARTIAAS